jgi:cold shock protein
VAAPVTKGTVRFWLGDEGWGVVDTPETPGGCWVHFSHVEIDGYRELIADANVDVEWEAAEQDGYPYRAVRVVPLRSA